MLKGQKLTTEMRREKYQVLIFKGGELDLVKFCSRNLDTHIGFCSATQGPDAFWSPWEGPVWRMGGRSSGHLAVNIRTGPGSAAHQPPGCPRPLWGRGGL